MLAAGGRRSAQAWGAVRAGRLPFQLVPPPRSGTPVAEQTEDPAIAEAAVGAGGVSSAMEGGQAMSEDRGRCSAERIERGRWTRGGRKDPGQTHLQLVAGGCWSGWRGCGGCAMCWTAWKAGSECGGSEGAGCACR